MLNTKKLEKWARYLNESVPKAINTVTYNLDAKIKKILVDHLQKIDLVTKQELNIQTQNLSKIKEKLHILETKIKILESTLNNQLHNNQNDSHNKNNS